MDSRNKSRVMGLLGGILMGAALCFLMGSAHAALIFNSDGTLVGSWAGKQTLTHGSPFAAAAGGGAVNYNTPGTALITGGKVPVSVPLGISQRVSAGAVGRLAVGALRGSIPGIIVGAGVGAAINAAGYECDITGCKTKEALETISATTETQTATSSIAPVETGYSTGGANSRWYKTAATACQVAIDGYKTTYPNIVVTSIQDPNPSDIYQAKCITSGGMYGGWVYTLYRLINSCKGEGVSPSSSGCPTVYSCPSGWVNQYNGQCQRLVCPAGYTRDGATCSRTVAGVPAPDTDVGDAVGPILDPADATSAVQQAVANNVPVPADPAVVTGPASVTSPSITTTSNTTINGGPTTNTTTNTTTTVHNTYQGSTYSYTVTNNTTTTNPDGSTTTTDEDVPEDATVNDSELPEVPKLYERKYPDGMQGVWDEKIGEIKATPLFSLPQVFAPNIAGGSCPSWTFNANIGPGMMLGTGSISPPCWVWDFIKAIVIIGSLMLARALIFGG